MSTSRTVEESLPTPPGSAAGWHTADADAGAGGGTAGRGTATATTALDSLGRVQANASQTTDLVLDVVGYYR